MLDLIYFLSFFMGNLFMLYMYRCLSDNIIVINFVPVEDLLLSFHIVIIVKLLPNRPKLAIKVLRRTRTAKSKLKLIRILYSLLTPDVY